ncbi:peptidase [Bacillus marinisedimentorum]|uniref:peptidase n=1 Tax=Bacillus marinisedimentorum TaxID=1821260 RepID=UPI0008728213|nr:peptidase [Bacillus marinisedimentorum]
MPELKKHVHDWLEAHREEGITLLQQMIQAPSTQGNEKAAQEIVVETLENMGLEVDVWDPDGNELAKNPAFASSRDEFTGSPNVVGVWKGNGDGRSVILNGHIDVVPAGDREQWIEDPYSGKIKDGKIYGRGATDMKGGNAALLLAIQTLQGLGIRLQGDVIFESVIEEESGGSGTLASVLRGYKADAAIIPEPTNMKIFPKQQGSMWFRIHIKGRSAHGGTRYEGVNAIEKSLAVVDHLRRLEEERNNRISDPLYEKIPIPVPINVGKIEGGDWPSSVPDLVKIEGRMGVSPEETMEEAKAEMDAWLKDLKEIDEWYEDHPVTLEWFGARWLPGSIDLGNDMIKALTERYRDVIGGNPVVEASPWGTDGGLLTKVGETPSVVFGPGVTGMAHYPNEYIELEKVFQAAEIIALTLVDWCGAENG